jgi:hypothetical protein
VLTLPPPMAHMHHINKCPFSDFHYYLSLYLPWWEEVDKWPDMKCGTSEAGPLAYNSGIEPYQIKEKSGYC